MSDPIQEPFFSIITVVKDDPQGFTRTRDSLISQGAASFEHIVIDSSSDRATIPVVLERHPVVGAHTTYEWVEPEGIYPAMNRGLEKATGAYAYFLNANDELISDSILRSTMDRLSATMPTWAFGEIEILQESGSPVTTQPWDYHTHKRWSFSLGRFPAHQATFVSTRSLQDLGGFSTQYSIVSDYQAFLRLSQISPPLYLDEVVARFREGGVSTVQWRAALREFHAARVDVLQPRGASRIREHMGTLGSRVMREVHHARTLIRN